MPQVSAVVLAGGRSSRMGRNKALLKLGAKSIIQTQVEKLMSIYNEVIVVSNEPELYIDLGVEVVKDIYENCGPLAGIHSGLTHSHNNWIFVLPCDMPYVPGNLGLSLQELAGDAHGVVLEKDGYREPLCALYSKSCLGLIEEILSSDRRKGVIDLYPRGEIKIVPVGSLDPAMVQDKTFFNMNTPDDYELAKEIEGKVVLNG